MEKHERCEPARVILVVCVCEACGVGRMVSTGRVLSNMPPLVEHKCDLCSVVKFFLKAYPYPEIIPEGHKEDVNKEVKGNKTTDTDAANV